MPKAYRLTGEEIKHLTEHGQGKRVHTPLFSLTYYQIEGAHPKYATVVSKKTAAKAVDRNTIKRRTRAALSKHLSEVQKPLALILYGKREVRTAPFAVVERDIRIILSKIV